MRTIHHDRLADGGLGPTHVSKTDSAEDTGTARTTGNLRGHAALFALVWALLLIGAAFADSSAQSKLQTDPSAFTIAPPAPVVNGWDFECDDGYYAAANDLGETIFIPNGWTLARAVGGPVVHSGRIFFEDRARSGAGCESNSQLVESIHGRDSLVIRSRDINGPNFPYGKPFDVILYQRIAVVPNAEYTSHGFFLSFCGGTDPRSKCPSEQFIGKALGIDPFGGTDPDAQSAIWQESRTPHHEIRWENRLSVPVIARSSHITIFIRMYTLEPHPGNFGHIDVIRLVRSPLAQFLPLPNVITGTRQIELRWEFAQSDDLKGDDRYKLLFDIDIRSVPDGEWRNFATGLKDTTSLAATVPCLERRYEFRIRARPESHFVGVWSAPVRVRFGAAPGANAPAAPGEHSLYLPAINGQPGC